MFDMALEANGLTKRYGRKAALRNVSIAIPKGAIVALVGPNGAGKSTLIRTFIGFERPTAGRVGVLGGDPGRDRSAAANVAYISQQPYLYRELDVRGHLDLVAHYRPAFDRTSVERRINERGIALNSRVGALSGGQVAMVSLTIALSAQAPVLLLDEPLASLDPLARQEFLHELGSTAANSGATVVLSSHLVGDLAAVCDWILVIGDGEVALASSIADAVAAHRVVDIAASASTPDRVASLPGSTHALHRNVGDARDTRPTLDQLVLGYLAEARSATGGAAS